MVLIDLVWVERTNISGKRQKNVKKEEEDPLDMYHSQDGRYPDP